MLYIEYELDKYEILIINSSTDIMWGFFTIDSSSTTLVFDVRLSGLFGRIIMTFKIDDDTVETSNSEHTEQLGQCEQSKPRTC